MANESWNPYRPGTRLFVRAHTPCPTVSRQLYETVNNIKPGSHGHIASVEMRTMTPLQRAVRYRRIPGDAEPSSEVTMDILSPISVGETQPAQLVKVVVEGVNQNRPVVAKFYDSAFADHEDPDFDAPEYVDFQYIREAAAYKKLAASRSTVAPRYFGSFTCDFITPLGPHTVRLILMEVITGPSLDKFQKKVLNSDSGYYEIRPLLPQYIRKRVLKKIVLLESVLNTQGVEHADIAFRNVMLLSPETLETDLEPSMVLIDFGDSYCCEPQEGMDLVNRRPVSPAIRWSSKSSLKISLSAWIDWDWQPWIEDWIKEYPMFAPSSETVGFPW